jgi:branched-chain amino acid transport system substrate-binding protein
VNYAKKIFQVILIYLLSSLQIQNKEAFCATGEPGKSVKIGLLIPDNNSVAARQGAELAVRKANEDGGFQGRPFELVVRSMEGPWGTGSKQAVSLIFEEKVWALMGSHDGRNAHLVEQAATKAIVPFVSAWAGDPTLSQAFVPWFFNCVPNDSQQAETLIDEIYTKRKYTRVVIVYDIDYDVNQVLNNFLKKAEMEHRPEPIQFKYENFIEKTDELTDQIINSDPECILLLCNPGNSLAIYRQIRERKTMLPVFSSHYILNENVLSGQELKRYDNSLFIASGHWSATKYSSFREEYEEMFGKPPGMVASYAFDGMSLLIEAIRKAGTPERELIQKSLEKISCEGITGHISFDSSGNRKGPYYLTSLINGIPRIEE